MTTNKIDPTVLTVIISAILALILKLRIKINRNSQTGIYQFLLDFQKQVKEDPELIDEMKKVLETSKNKSK